MKRMYVVLGLILLAFLWALSSMGQKSQDLSEQMQKRLELREEMHRRMMDKLLRGIGPDQDLFKDMEQMFEESMSDSLINIDTFRSNSSAFASEWVSDEKGRTLVITPKDAKQQLDIDVKGQLITIKGKSERSSQQGSFISSFSNSFSVPEDCDGTQVKMDQKDGKILVHFPFIMAQKFKSIPRQKDERTPLPPTQDGVEI